MPKIFSYTAKMLEMSDMVLYNFRSPTLDTTTHKLYIADPNGNALGAWDGSGTTEDGLEVSALGHNLINTTYYITGDGRLLLFVVSGHVPASPTGTIDRLDVLEIVALNTVRGAVTLGDFDGDAA
ncbi:MAG: hypothetical protein ACUVR7_01590 [Armatimonadota bacterium]